MYQFQLFFHIVAIIPIVHCTAFGASSPTGTGSHRTVDAISPKPTKGLSIHELRQRQFDELSVETCGWINGDFSSAVTCNPGKTCLFYSTFGANMAGCCSNTRDTQDCGWANRCVNYKDYNAGACDSDCEANSFVAKCSDVKSPYCATWTYPSVNIVDYGCATINRKGVFTVFPRGIDLWDSFSTTITVGFLTGDEVTGWDISTGRDVGGEATTAKDPDGTGLPAPSDKKTAKKLAIGVIVGIAIGGLVLVVAIAVAICCLCRRRKQKNQNAATNANRPPSQHSQAPIALEPHQVPPYHSQNGYYSPHAIHEQKYPELYGSQTPSTPGTPTPQYSQTYYGAHPMPEAPGNHRGRPVHGVHEIDAWSSERPTTAPGQPATPQAVYEMGYGR